MSSVVTDEAEAAEGDALRGRVPLRVADPQRLEEARPQVVDERRAASPSGRSPRACRSPACCRGSACRACARRAGPGTRASGTTAGSPKGNGSITSAWWPVDIASRSRTRIAFRFSLGSAGASSGKKESTVSSRLSLPSAIARPTPVDVKLLLSEKSTCGSSRRYGPHQPSATTLAVAQHHEAVQRVDVLLGGLDEGEDRGGRDALGLGSAARQRGRLGGSGRGGERAGARSISWPRLSHADPKRPERGQILN